MVFFLFLVIFLLDCSLLSRSVIADGIRGYLEFDYNDVTTKTTDQAGETLKTKGDNFRQNYNLSLRRALFPNVFLNAGGNFEKISARSNADGDVTRFSTGNVRPFVDLTLKNPLFTLGGKYNRREVRQKGTDLSTLTNINEIYTMIFGWRPEGLPSTDVRLEKTKSFDRERATQDTVSDSLFVTFNYVPEYGHLKGLNLQYRPSYRKVQEKLHDVVTTTLGHNGTVTFSDTFFNRRVSLNTSYNIAYSEQEITRSTKTTEIFTSLFPFSGLSAVDFTPAKVVLALNSALIDGNLTSSANIDIGVPGLGGNTDPRNIGLDFIVETEVNTIFLWVDRELPTQISGAFKWDIYTSSDNDNWTLLTTVPIASFGPFQNRFEIDFSNVKTRFIKVVTTPLKVGDTAGVPGDFSNIFVTEIQAFLKTPSGKFDRESKDTGTNQIYNLDVRTKILDIPLLYYEFSYYFTKSASIFRSAVLSNGLSASHRFSSIISAQARIAREDDIMQDESDLRYLYNASVTARPLRTLYHTLNYSGQTEEIGEEKSNTNSVFLNNTAELYNGISLRINGGASFKRNNTGVKSTNTSYSLGVGIIPHKRVNVDLYYENTDTKTSGGDQPDSKNFTRRGNFSVSYRPFDTVYLSVSYDTIATLEKTRKFLSYGIDWSPFPGGSLQFAFSYKESLTVDEGRSRQIIQSAIWNINRQTSLLLSSLINRNTSDVGKADIVTSSAALRTAF